jgi:hypothetical protein
MIGQGPAGGPKTDGEVSSTSAETARSSRSSRSMRTTVVVPTFWTKARGQVKDTVFNAYDHPVPLDGEGGLSRTLESLRALRGNFDVQVVGAVDDPVYESQLDEKLAQIAAPFADNSVSVFGPAQLRTLKGRLEQLGLEKFAGELALEGYGNVRNIGLLLGIAYESEAVIFIDDSALVEDPSYVETATEFLGGQHEGHAVLGKTGIYGGPKAARDQHWWDMFWREDQARRRTLEMAERGPRLSRAPMAIGGAMALHHDMFCRVSFDPWVPRGEATDYVINARMHGLDLYFDNKMVVLDDPPATPRPGRVLRQDIYRFVYEHRKLEYARSQVDLKQVKASELEPYPGDFLGVGIGLKAGLTAGLATAAHLGQASEWTEALSASLGRAGALARANCARYFEFSREWPVVAEKLWDDLPLQTALGARG